MISSPLPVVETSAPVKTFRLAGEKPLIFSKSFDGDDKLYICEPLEGIGDYRRERACGFGNS